MDKNFRSYADVSDVVIEGEAIAPPDKTYADAFKLSHAEHVHVSDCTIVGGYEDCVDMNRGTNDVLLEHVTLQSGGKFCCTIKGGTHNVTFKGVEITKHGTETDIDLGNWSDQSSELTRDIILQDVWAADGKPVRVRVLWAERPTVIGGNVRVTVVPRWIVWCYRLLRKHNLVP